MRFSEREGFKPVRQIFQVDSVDEPLRNCLWNAIDWSILRSAVVAEFGEYSEFNYYDYLWVEYYKQREDERPEQSYHIREYISKQIFDGPWYEIYDFIEYALEHFPFENVPPDSPSRTDFISNCNDFLKREMSAYRIIDDKIARVTFEEEIASIEKATEYVDRFAPVSTHIKTALAHLSRRQATIPLTKHSRSDTLWLLNRSGRYEPSSKPHLSRREPSSRMV